MSAAPVYLPFQHEGVNGLTGIVPVGRLDQRYLSRFLIDFQLDGRGDKVETVDEISFSRLPVDDVDVRRRPVAPSVERGSPVVIGLPNGQEKVDSFFRAPFDENPFVLEFKLFRVSL